MDISALEVFSLVVKQGSFARAARELNIDPSSISRSITALEDELDMRLFQRDTRKLALTEAGTIYHQRIEPLVSELHQAREAASDVSNKLKGSLRITASVSFGVQYLVPRLPTFSDRYPDLSIDLVLNDAVLDLVAERIDVGIRLGTLPDTSLIAHRWMTTRYLVVASPGYLKRHGTPKKPQDITTHNCLRFPLDGFNSRWIFKDKKDVETEVRIGGKLSVNNGMGMGLQQCAIAGMGISLLPSWLIEKDLTAGRLIDLFPQWRVTATDFNTAVWFVYPSRAYVPQKVRVLMEHLRTS